MADETKKTEALKRLRNNASEYIVGEIKAALPGLSFINETLTDIANDVDGMKYLDEYKVRGIAALVNGIEEAIYKAINNFSENWEEIAGLEAKHAAGHE